MVSKTCPLIVRDLYFYDFKSAFPRILQSVDFNFNGIDLSDKEERNISIGLAQRENENISSFLSNSIDNLLNLYIKENNISDNDIIITQRDGFILKKMLDKTNLFMELDYRGFIDYLIITPDRKKFLYIKDDDVIVKGMSNRYDKLDIIYKKFSLLNFYDKKILFSQLQDIRDLVFNSKDKNFFIIEYDGKKYIQTFSGAFEITSDNIFQIEDIDKRKYYDHYFREFTQSIFIEFY